MQHEQQVSQQDEMLDDMSTVVSRLQLMSVEMGEEIELQNQCVSQSFPLAFLLVASILFCPCFNELYLFIHMPCI